MAFPQVARRPAVHFSYAELGKAAGDGGNISSSATSFTTGMIMIPTRAGDKIEGFRFYWPGATAKTVKCSLFNAAGTNVSTVNVSVNGAGFYTAWFTAPVALTAYANYYLGVWVTDGSIYYYMTVANYNTTTGRTAPAGAPNGLTLGNNILAGENFIRVSSGYAGAGGDAVPSTADTTTVMGFMDPIFTPVVWP